MYNYSKLIGRIIEKYGSRKEFAKALGIKNTELSLKLNNKRMIKKEQMLKMIELLDIPKKEVYDYFFIEE